MNILLNIILNLYNHKEEMQDSAISLLVYCTIGSIVTVIKGFIVKMLVWDVYIIVELLYILGMSVGFLLATAPIVGPIVKVFRNSNLIDTLSPMILDMVKLQLTKRDENNSSVNDIDSLNKGKVE